MATTTVYATWWPVFDGEQEKLTIKWVLFDVFGFH